MRNVFAPTALALAVTAGLAACAGTGSEASTAQAEEQRTAVLFVERQASEPGNSAHVGARFVQYTGIPSDALPDLLGTPRVPGALTGCYERTDSAVDTAGARAEARLLDVGPIDVRAGDRSLRLEPRQFPDLWNVVSGVIYATDGELPSDVWRFSAPGNPQSKIDAFSVEAQAPADLSSVTLAEQALVPGATLVLPRHGFHVAWPRGEHEDSVVAVFEPAGGAESAPTVACAAHDDGALDVDASWAERIAEAGAQGVTVTVHRVRARPFAVSSVDQAQVVFDLSVHAQARAE